MQLTFYQLFIYYTYRIHMNETSSYNNFIFKKLNRKNTKTQLINN